MTVGDVTQEVVLLLKRYMLLAASRSRLGGQGQCITVGAEEGVHVFAGDPENVGPVGRHGLIMATAKLKKQEESQGKAGYIRLVLF